MNLMNEKDIILAKCQIKPNQFETVSILHEKMKDLLYTYINLKSGGHVFIWLVGNCNKNIVSNH